MNVTQFATITEYFNATWFNFNLCILSQLFTDDIKHTYADNENECETIEGREQVINEYRTHYFEDVENEYTSISKFVLMDERVAFSVNQKHRNDVVKNYEGVVDFIFSNDNKQIKKLSLIVTNVVR